ncbi:RING finger protein 215-like isoform X2 [Apostichopus japonicus]|uniref:RING finger protein 215-like isoform X2 n=1 Tax=Stichopus japonicus TaxID=307972 RepID=UPI003AB7D34F
MMTPAFRLSKISWFRIDIDRSVFAWMVLLSIGIHVVTGDRDAMVQVLASGEGVLGQYSTLGAGDTVVTGILHEVTGNCTKKFVHSILPDEEPIGILFLPEVDESKNHKEPSQSTTCTILDQVKQVMLLGCSALVVLALNPSILKELDGSQTFSKPIVKVSSKQNVELVKKEIKSTHSKKAIIKPIRRKKDESPAVVSVPKLTLWSTCGKSIGGTHREWEGTVCLGVNPFTSPKRMDELVSAPRTCSPGDQNTPLRRQETSNGVHDSKKTDHSRLKYTTEQSRGAQPEFIGDSLHLEQDAPLMGSARSCVLKGGVENDVPWRSVVCYGGGGDRISFSTIWQYVFSLIVSVYVILTFKKTRRPQRLEDVEDSLQRLAKLSVSKMPTRKYKKKKGSLTSQESDNCAICLDEFSKGQVIRMLPCDHHFHCKCVDDWLIKRRTCPLCKMDIVDQRFHCYSNL